MVWTTDNHGYGIWKETAPTKHLSGYRSSNQSQNKNPIFTEEWRHYLHPSTTKATPRKQLLQYRKPVAAPTGDSFAEGRLEKSTSNDSLSCNSVNSSTDTSGYLTSCRSQHGDNHSHGIRENAADQAKGYQALFCSYCYGVEQTFDALAAGNGRAVPVTDNGPWKSHNLYSSCGAISCPLLYYGGCPHCGATRRDVHSPDLCWARGAMVTPSASRT